MNRLKTPNTVARVLRREAGFGCCKCGNPIFQYHHIIDYASDPHFRVEDMMILCNNHHNEATQGILSEIEQRRLKKSPFNKSNGNAGGLLRVDQVDCNLRLADSLFVISEGSVVEVDSEPLISVELGEANNLLLNLWLYDKDDNLSVRIEGNEWLSDDPLPWDVEFSYRRLKIRQALRDISLQIDATEQPIKLTAKLWRKGREIKLLSDGIHVDDAHMIGGGQKRGFMIALREGQNGFALAPQRLHLRRNDPPPGRNEPCWCGSNRRYKTCHGRLDRGS